MIPVLLGLLGALVGAAVWLLGPLYVLTDASRRAMSRPRLWAVGCLLTGPLGLVAYLFDRPRSGLIQCPTCGHNVEATDIRCVYCGRSIH